MHLSRRKKYTNSDKIVLSLSLLEFWWSEACTIYIMIKTEAITENDGISESWCVSSGVSSRRNSEKTCAQNLKQPHFIYKNQAKMRGLQMTSILCRATKKKIQEQYKNSANDKLSQQLFLI